MDPASLLAGAAVGAAVAEILKALIAEAKKVRAFRSSFKKLVSTMEKLIPAAQEIDLLYDKLDLEKDELKDLRDAMKRAQELIQKCSKVRCIDFYRKSVYGSKISEIDRKFHSFFQIDIQLILLKNLLKSVHSIQSLRDKLDRIGLGGNQLTGLWSVPDTGNVTVGLEKPLKNLKAMLFAEGTNAVVVSAPGGCGKTTLVKQLCHDEEVRGKFGKIFFFGVSKDPIFKLIVQNFLKHNGFEVPEFRDDETPTVILQNMLKQIGRDSSMLLVLDDVWGGEELLLQRFLVKLPNYKILVTSQFELPTIGHTYRLEPLKDEDARTLLLNIASEPDYGSRAEFEDLLRKILKCCSGFPLAIEVVAGLLKGRSLSSWKGVAVEWSRGEEFVNAPEVLKRLQPIIDSLGERLKDRFLDMGSFLEGQKIRASTICDLWEELYRSDEAGELVPAMKYLEDLSFRNLLKLVSLGRIEHEDDFYNEYIVTQHNILRMLAIHISESEQVGERKRLNLEIRHNKFPKWCLDLTQPVRARLLSVSTDDSFSSNWVDMNCPEVEALVLHFFSSAYALPGFIAKMEKLKVLILTNHGFFPAKVSNFSCFSSLSSLRRIRLEKAILSLLDISQLRLGNLEKLSMVMCSFEEVFYDSGIDISGALPSLEEIDIDYCADLHELPYWICEVVSLKKLSIANCNRLSTLPEDIGKLRSLEVMRLRSCINLTELPETVTELSELCYLDVSDCISLKKLPSEIGKLQKLKKISMRKCGGCELPESVKNLENLEVQCDEETEVLWQRFKPHMRTLRVHVQKSEQNLNWLQML